MQGQWCHLALPPHPLHCQRDRVRAVGSGVVLGRQRGCRCLALLREAPGERLCLKKLCGCGDCGVP